MLFITKITPFEIVETTDSETSYNLLKLYYGIPQTIADALSRLPNFIIHCNSENYNERYDYLYSKMIVVSDNSLSYLYTVLLGYTEGYYLIESIHSDYKGFTIEFNKLEDSLLVPKFNSYFRKKVITDFLNT